MAITCYFLISFPRNEKDETTALANQWRWVSWWRSVRFEASPGESDSTPVRRGGRSRWANMLTRKQWLPFVTGRWSGPPAGRAPSIMASVPSRLQRPSIILTCYKGKETSAWNKYEPKVKITLFLFSIGLILPLKKKGLKWKFWI